MQACIKQSFQSHLKNVKTTLNVTVYNINVTFIEFIISLEF